MHDVSEAQALADAILKAIEGRKPGEIEVDVSLGALRLVSPKEVEFWLKEILRKSLGDGLKVKANITIVNPEIKCKCGFKGEAVFKTSEETAHFGIYEMKCLECGSEDYEIVKGRECTLLGIRAK